VRRLAFSLLLGATVGCTGAIESHGGGGPSGSNPPPGSNMPMPGPGNPTPTPAGPGQNPTPDPTAPPSAQVACGNGVTETVGRRTLRRLTIPELETTIRSTFALDAKQWVGLNVPPDTGSDDGFTNNVDHLTVSADYARGAQDSSRQVAALVSAEPMLSKLVPCAATGGASCADTFLGSFGTKLYRRPLTAAEKARYLALFGKTSAEGFGSFVYWATSTMLQSPNVLYRSELGAPDGTGRYKLDPYEVASELSYTFIGGPPTPDLLQLAAQNKLGTADELEAAARGLVLSGATVTPGFRDVVLRFADQWLGLSRLANVKKDAMLYPTFNDQVQSALAEETRRFLSAVLFDDKGSVASLLTAPYTFVDATLAKYYGFGAATGTEFVKVNRPAEWGVGLLAQGSMLSVLANGITTSPTRRGHVVRSTLMCNVVPPPPPTVNPNIEPSEAKTTRQRYEEVHSADPGCRSCHQMMDPIGFALEGLDAAGRFRTTENNLPVDSSGTVTGTSKGDLKVKGPTELATAVAGLPEVTDCVAAYLGAYALGVGHDNARCLVNTATAGLKQGGSLLDFYLHIARSEHFRYRQ
jgi:hypothetical protein